MYLKAPLQSINAKTGSGLLECRPFQQPHLRLALEAIHRGGGHGTQQKLAGQIQRLLLDETPIIFAYFYNYLSASQKNVTGTYPTAQGQFFLWNAAKA